MVDALVGTGLAPSRAAARRTIKEGGAYLNNHQVTDEDAAIEGGLPARALGGAAPGQARTWPRWNVVR